MAGTRQLTFLSVNLIYMALKSVQNRPQIEPKFMKYCICEAFGVPWEALVTQNVFFCGFAAVWGVPWSSSGPYLGRLWASWAGLWHLWSSRFWSLRNFEFVDSSMICKALELTKRSKSSIYLAQHLGSKMRDAVYNVVYKARRCI